MFTPRLTLSWNCPFTMFTPSSSSLAPIHDHSDIQYISNYYVILKRRIYLERDHNCHHFGILNVIIQHKTTYSQVDGEIHEKRRVKKTEKDKKNPLNSPITN